MVQPAAAAGERKIVGCHVTDAYRLSISRALFILFFILHFILFSLVSHVYLVLYTFELDAKMPQRAVERLQRFDGRQTAHGYLRTEPREELMAKIVIFMY